MTEEKTRRETDRRVVRTKKAIKSALMRLLEEKDIYEITISELTRKAGINRRTFYTHYRSISEISEEIEIDMVALLSEVVLKIDLNNMRQSIYNVFTELDNIVSAEFDYYLRRVKMGMRGVFLTRLKGIASEIAEKMLATLPNITRKTAELASDYLVGGFVNAFVEWRNSSNATLEQAATLAGIMSEGVLESIKKV